MLLYVPQPRKLLSKYFPQKFDVPSVFRRCSAVPGFIVCRKRRVNKAALNKLCCLKMQICLRFSQYYLKYSFVKFLILHFNAYIYLDLNEISFFLVHMMDEISQDTPCNIPEKAPILF